MRESGYFQEVRNYGEFANRGGARPAACGYGPGGGRIERERQKRQKTAHPQFPLFTFPVKPPKSRAREAVAVMWPLVDSSKTVGARGFAAGLISCLRREKDIDQPGWTSGDLVRPP